MEVLVSLGVVSCLIIVLSSFSKTAFNFFGNLEKTQSVAMTFEDVRLVLKSDGQCTLNLQGLPLGMALTTGSQVPQIMMFNAANQPQNVVAKVGESAKGLKLEDLRLVPVAQIDATLFVANVEMTFQKIADGGAQSLNRVIPIFARVQNGKLTKCWEKQVQANVEINQACLILSDGALNTVDINSKECTLMNGKWFTGSAQFASCPSGSVLPPKANAVSNCDYSISPSFVDTFATSDRVLTDGTTATVARPPVVMDLDPANASCRCGVALDLTPAQAAQIQCKILCLVP